MNSIALPSYQLDSSETVLSRLSCSPFSNKQGLTPSQAMVDQAISSFLEGVTNVQTLTALTGGSYAYRLGRLGVLGLGAEWQANSILPTLFRGGSYLVGFAAESATFAGVNRAFSSLEGEKPLHSFTHDLAQAAITLAPLKIVPSLFQNQNIVFQHLVTDGSMVAGNQLASRFHLGEKPHEDLLTQLFQSEAVNWQMVVGMGLVYDLAPALFGAERSMDLILQSQQGMVSKGLGNFYPPSESRALVLEGLPSTLRPWQLDQEMTKSFPVSMMSVEKGENDPRGNGSTPPPEVGAPSGSEGIHGETNLPKLTPPPPPQLTFELQLEDLTAEAMVAFPDRVKKAHEESGEVNPVHFGLNHLKWWLALTRQHFGELGANALVLGGQILFGRFQENPEGQEKVRKELSALAKKGKLEMKVRMPLAESLWRPFWDQVLSESNAQESSLAAILQRVQKSDPELAKKWVMEIAEQDVVKSLSIEEQAGSAALSYPHPLDPHFISSLNRLYPLFEAGDWPQVNHILADIYHEAYSQEDLALALAQVEALLGVLQEGLKLAERQKAKQLQAVSPDLAPLKPRQIPDAKKTPVAVELGKWAEGMLLKVKDLVHPQLNPTLIHSGEEGRYEAIALAALSYVYQSLGEEKIAKETQGRAIQAGKDYFKNRPFISQSPAAAEERLWLEIEQFASHPRWLGRKAPSWPKEVHEILALANAGQWTEALEATAQIPDRFFSPVALALIAKVAKEQGLLKTRKEKPTLPLFPNQLTHTNSVSGNKFSEAEIDLIQVTIKLIDKRRGSKHLLEQIEILGWLAEVQKMLGRSADAKKLLGEAEALIRSLLEEDPDVPSFQSSAHEYTKYQDLIRRNPRQWTHLTPADLQVIQTWAAEKSSDKDLLGSLNDVIWHAPFNPKETLAPHNLLHQAARLYALVEAARNQRPAPISSKPPLPSVLPVSKTQPVITARPVPPGLPANKTQPVISRPQSIKVTKSVVPLPPMSGMIEAPTRIRSQDVMNQLLGLDSLPMIKESIFELDENPLDKVILAYHADDLNAQGETSVHVTPAAAKTSSPQEGIREKILGEIQSIAKGWQSISIPFTVMHGLNILGYAAKLLGDSGQGEFLHTKINDKTGKLEGVFPAVNPDLHSHTLLDLAPPIGTGAAHVLQDQLIKGIWVYPLDSKKMKIKDVVTKGQLGEWNLALEAARQLDWFEQTKTIVYLAQVYLESSMASALNGADASATNLEIRDYSPFATLPPSINYFERLNPRDPATLPADYLHLIPKPSKKVLFPRFLRILNEMAFLVNSNIRIAIRLFGPPGTAKTTIPEMVAAKLQVPLLRFPFSKRTDPSDLEGLWALEAVKDEDGTEKVVPVFREGAPTVAMEHGFHLVLDEPDLARPGVLAFLNNVSAPGPFAWVRKKNGQLIKIAVHPDYRAWATENGVQQIAREEHGKDFLRRFVPYYIGPWSKEEITQVLADLYENYGGQNRWSRKTTEMLALVQERMALLAKGMHDPKTNRSLPPLGSGVGQQVEFTPRSVLRIAQRLVASGPLTPASLSRAIRAEYILPLADPQDRELVWGQIQALFKPLADEMGWAQDAIGPKSIPQPTLEGLSKKYFGGRKLEDGDFVWTDQALHLVDEILWNRSLGIDVMLLGEASEGKTEIPPQIARLLGMNYYAKTISSETDEEDLVGGLGRIDGKIDFIPGVLTLGTQQGGMIHLDEYLLGETGKLEGVMNPFMDDDRTLILKTPFRLIPRHADTFLILTSNPPFGDYADRHEHSGAAMSRVAVIYLNQEFGMGVKDRKKILKTWARQPMAVENLPVGGAKKKDLKGERALIQRFAREAQKNKEGNHLLPSVHPEVAERFEVPTELALDRTTAQVLEKNESGAWVPIGLSNQKALDKFAAYLTRQTEVDMAPLTSRVFSILYKNQGANTTYLEDETIFLNIVDLLRFPVGGGLGIGKHEWAHATIDRPSMKYDAHEPGRLFANVVGDPRMNEYAASLRHDFGDQIQAFNRILWPKKLGDEEVNLFLSQLPHEQFAASVIYAWFHGEIMPWIVDEKVIQALNEALPILRPAFTLFPESTAAYHVDVAAAEFYKILDQAWPIYQALIPESLQKLMELLEQGVSPEELLEPLLRPGSGTPGMGEPGPKTGSKLDSKEEASQGGQEGEGDKVTAKEKAGKTNGGSAMGEADPSGSPTVKGSEVTGKDSQMGEESTNTRTQPSGPEIQKKNLEKLEKLAKEILDQRAKKLADQFEPQDPAQRKKRQDEIARAKAQAEKSTQAGDPKPESDPLSTQEKQVIQEAQQAALDKATEGDLFRRMVPPRAVQAAKRLKKVLPPTDPVFMEGFFRSGKRLDRKKAVQDDISPVPSGKVMLRRLGLGAYDVNLVMLSDVSPSIPKAGAKENTLRATAAAIFLAEELKIQYGEIFFSGEIEEGKPLGKPVNSYVKKNELLSKKEQSFKRLEHRGGGTNIRDPLAKAIQWIEKRPAKVNYILLITDGEENVLRNAKTIPTLVREAEAAGIHVLVLAMGDAKRFVPKLFKPHQYRFCADDGSDIADMIIELFAEAHRKRF